MFPKNLDWSDIKNYEKYEIGADEDGNCYFRNKKTKYVLKPIKQRSGYYVLNIYSKIVYIHKLIAIQYLDNSNCYKVVDHKDGNKSNNNISNLEWVTTSINNQNRLFKGVEVKELPKSSKQLLSYMARKMHYFSNYYYGDNCLYRMMRDGRYEKLSPVSRKTGKYTNWYYSVISTKREHVYIPVSVITKMCQNE